MLQAPSDVPVLPPTPEPVSSEQATPVAMTTRLERAAVALAETHTLMASKGAPVRQLALPARLPALARFLQSVHRHLLTTADEAVAASYAAEWLLDNFYAVERAQRQVKEDLPTGYYHELPKLNTPTTFAGYPRVYAIARAFLTFEEYQFDLERLVRYILAYQQQTPLTMGEVWALPIMLRFVLLEDLALAAQRIAGLTEAADYDHLERTTTVEDAELVASSIPALRQLDTQDWQSFFERVSLVHQLLCDDPMAVYNQMDFATRNQYRTVIEQLAVATGVVETNVAQMVVDLARAAYKAADGADAPLIHGQAPPSSLTLLRTCHVGYYLLDQGRAQLEERLHYRPRGWTQRQRWILAHPTLFYLGSTLLITLLMLGLVTLYVLRVGGSAWAVGGVLLLTVIPVLTLASNWMNWLVTHTLPPHVLPKLDFSEGIPAQYRTMVVIPALITSKAEVATLFNELEQHYLRNPDPYLTFALLSDFGDADQEVMPTDAALLAQAQSLVDGLNERYPQQPFYFFHRQRRWNASEKRWLGWERKRGKIHEFNQLLRGASDTSYTVQHGNLAVLPQTRYVITLDADTVLPNEGAHRLIGTLAHPLNHAEFAAQTSKVRAGYTILQPRTMIKPNSANRSLFTRIFAGDSGLDLYTLAVSDLYQDLFGAGIYVGKGIYDVDAFERSLVGRVPDNSLLSHDLFEGVHGRVGLATDIILYEDYPPHYLVTMLRLHRWVRGDWQLLPWLFPNTPRLTGRAPTDLALIDRWKLADNLRRSLLPPALLLLFLGGWTVLPGSPWVWTLVGLLTPAFSLVTSAVTGLWHTLTTTEAHPWQRFVHTLRNNALRWLLFLAFLPHEALLTLDAVGRTLVRLFIRRRKMLEWTTAARAVRLFGSEVTVATTLLRMWPSILLVALIALLVSIVNPSALLFSAPFFLVWLLAAEIAYWISRPVAETPIPPTDAQRRLLRLLARRTWLFYEQFVGPNDNWLPPDHFQESPRGVVAHRTSPTNVGLYLLAMLAAHDLGYISANDLTVRLRFTFETLAKLTRYRGHFLNWIDTSSLQTLPPGYVSTVDSGNLAGCLLALKHGCLGLAQQQVWRWQWWEGFIDTIELLATTVLTTMQVVQKAAPIDDAPLHSYLPALHQRIAAIREQPEQWLSFLQTLVRIELPQVDRYLAAIIEQNASLLDTESLQGYRIAIERIHHHLHTMERELTVLLPWLDLLREPPPLFTAPEAPATVSQLWQQLVTTLPIQPRWGEVATRCADGQQVLAQICAALDTSFADTNKQSTDQAAVNAARAWCTDLANRLATAQTMVTGLLNEASTLAAEADRLVAEMDFSFLYNEQRKVFHIGYNLDTGRLDNSYYDLLASEARIASLLAIAKHDVPYQHWLHLGRPLTKTSTGEQALLSWSGTMFEYLMPPLLLRSYPDTLLHQSCRAVVEHQIAYGQAKGTPWGISESGFYTFDAAQNYQYYAFGAPGLGFKRGLSEDLVIAPYASLMALPLAPQAVLENIERLTSINALGRYGFYEAIDFTPAHLTLGQEYGLVRSYMAHHQGMIMLALADYLQGKRMVERFHAEPMIQSVELLLQEQMPPGAPLQYPHEDEQHAPRPPKATAAVQPWSPPINSSMPLVHFLSNGRYGLLLTNAGSGYSGNGDLRFTRWRADTTLDDWGCWLYIHDLENQALWSASRQPSGVRGEHEEVIFHPHMAEFRRRDDNIAVQMEVIVAPEQDVEIRRVTLTNESDQPRRLGLASYGEVVLAASGADGRHPAFAKLFVESEYLPEMATLLFRQRPRSATETPNFLAHTLVRNRPAGQPTASWPAIRYESDRARFLGRNHTARQPVALSSSDWWLNDAPGMTGATLDPVMVLGQVVELPPHSSVQLAWLTLTAPTREETVALARRFRSWSTIERAFVRARSQAERELRELGFQGDLLRHTQQLLSLLLYPHAVQRAEPALLAANRRGQSNLWGFGISGDYPILLVRLRSESEGELLQELLLAHTYWRRRGLRIDLVILNQQDTDYGQSLQNYIYRLIRRLDSDSWVNQRGGIFILRGDQMGEEDRILLQTAARVLLDGHQGLLAAQLADLERQPTPLPIFEPMMGYDRGDEARPALARPTDLQFDNGLGGFSADGREYVLYLQPGETTPAPWINVVANADFGFLATEQGGGYTWAVNSGENRLTPWRNDPVSDLPAEIIYLRDEENAVIWSPLPQPIPAAAPYLVRHGAGYTIYEHNSHSLRQEVRLFVAPDAPVKIIKVRLENTSEQPRRLTITYYAEWVLGVNRDSSQPFVVPEYEESCQALLAHNTYNAEFGERVAFVAASKELHGLTADRTEFLGRLGTLQRPAALQRIGLASRVQAGLDPCAALQLHIDLPVGGSEEIWFLLGQGANRSESMELVRRFHEPGQVEATWQAVHQQWDAILGTVQVTTPDSAMNVLLNRWLLYQALACRIWGRSALYQSSGAYGFRDQLQDTMALIHARPDLVREHLLRSTRHQFDAGDVLHWWHPPTGRGVRTRITDDLAWLPYVTAHYIAATGDTAVLQERTPFLRGAPLAKEEEERYAQYEATSESFTLYEHCRRALEKAVTAGQHGIPLMGAGDWNDGMNRVGIEGKGESIWLGWFLHGTLSAFASLCETIGDTGPAAQYRAQAEAIRQAVEAHGWDGAWYRRAYYDDGSPLGSAQNSECQIDAIAQSWAVLTGAGDADRARQAMSAVLERLVRREDRLLLLFTPPFDKTTRDPGYIKGYLPGIRENGGQYTHAALWTIWAFADLGDGDTAEELFRLINPIYRSDSPEKAALYKVEPYVIAADVYGVAPHGGRGGWTWYTGSSGWMYRLGIEGILGLQRVSDTLVVNPCIPKGWPGYRMTYRFGQSTYEIRVENPEGVNRGVQQITLDGQVLTAKAIPLVDDGGDHQVVIVLGNSME